MKFIQLTDCHVIGGDQLLYGANPARRLKLAVNSINSEHSDAQFVIITGDLTHWGDAPAYDAFAAEIARLLPPVHLLIGNHDDTPAFARTFPNAPRDPNGFVQTVIDTPHGTGLCLDTKLPGTHAGGYCTARRNWLAQQLDQIDGPILLFMHHPPFQIGIPFMDQIMLQQADQFWNIIAPHAHRIRHLFFGHAHRAIFGNWRGISYSCMRGLNHQVALDLKGADPTFPADLADPAYGVVLLDDTMVTVHMHEFAHRAPRFSMLPPEGMDPVQYALDMRHDGFQDLDSD